MRMVARFTSTGGDRLEVYDLGEGRLQAAYVPSRREVINRGASTSLSEVITEPLDHVVQVALSQGWTPLDLGEGRPEDRADVQARSWRDSLDKGYVSDPMALLPKPKN